MRCQCAGCKENAAKQAEQEHTGEKYSEKPNSTKRTAEKGGIEHE